MPKGNVSINFSAKGADKLDRSIKGIRSSTKSTVMVLEEMRKTLDRIEAKGLTGMQKQMDASASASQKLKAQLDKQATTIKQLEDKIKKYDTELNKNTKSTNTNKAAIEKQGKGIRNLIPHVAAVTLSYMAMRRAVAAVTAAIEAGADFEHQMALVGGIVRATTEDFEMLTAAAREAGETTVWTATEAAQALRYLGMAGFNAAESIAALPGVLNLALIGEMDLGRATDIATDTLRAFGLAATESSRVVDVFVGTITRSNTNIEAMGQAMKFVAPVASKLGYSVEEVSAMVGVLSQSGIKAGIAGRALRMSFLRQSEAAAKLGIESGNLIDVLKELRSRNLVPEELTNTLKDLFGLRSTPALLTLLEGIDQLETFTTTLENASGETDAFIERLDTTEVAWRKLNSVIADVAISIFLDNSAELKNALKDIAQWINENKPLIKDFFQLFVDGAKLAAKAINGLKKALDIITIEKPKGRNSWFDNWADLLVDLFGGDPNAYSDEVAIQIAESLSKAVERRTREAIINNPLDIKWGVSSIAFELKQEAEMASQLKNIAKDAFKDLNWWDLIPIEEAEGSDKIKRLQAIAEYTKKITEEMKEIWGSYYNADNDTFKNYIKAKVAGFKEEYDAQVKAKKDAAKIVAKIDALTLETEEVINKAFLKEYVSDWDEAFKTVHESDKQFIDSILRNRLNNIYEYYRKKLKFEKESSKKSLEIHKELNKEIQKATKDITTKYVDDWAKAFDEWADEDIKAANKILKGIEQGERYRNDKLQAMKSLYDDLNDVSGNYYEAQLEIIKLEKEKYIESLGLKYKAYETATTKEKALFDALHRWQILKQRELVQEYLIANEGFTGGMVAYLIQMRTEWENYYQDIGQFGYDFLDSMGDTFEDSFVVFFREGTDSAKEVWENFLDDLLNSFLKLIAQLIKEWALSGLLELFSSNININVNGSNTGSGIWGKIFSGSGDGGWMDWVSTIFSVGKSGYELYTGESLTGMVYDYAVESLGALLSGAEIAGSAYVGMYAEISMAEVEAMAAAALADQSAAYTAAMANPGVAVGGAYAAVAMAVIMGISAIFENNTMKNDATMGIDLSAKISDVYDRLFDLEFLSVAFNDGFTKSDAETQAISLFNEVAETFGTFEKIWKLLSDESQQALKESLKEINWDELVITAQAWAKEGGPTSFTAMIGSEGFAAWVAAGRPRSDAKPWTEEDNKYDDYWMEWKTALYPNSDAEVYGPAATSTDVVWAMIHEYFSKYLGEAIEAIKDFDVYQYMSEEFKASMEKLGTDAGWENGVEAYFSVFSANIDQIYAASEAYENFNNLISGTSQNYTEYNKAVELASVATAAQVEALEALGQELSEEQIEDIAQGWAQIYASQVDDLNAITEQATAADQAVAAYTAQFEVYWQEMIDAGIDVEKLGNKFVLLEEGISTLIESLQTAVWDEITKSIKELNMEMGDVENTVSDLISTFASMWDALVQVNASAEDFVLLQQMALQTMKYQMGLTSGFDKAKQIEERYSRFGLSTAELIEAFAKLDLSGLIEVANALGINWWDIAQDIAFLIEQEQQLYDIRKAQAELSGKNGDLWEISERYGIDYNKIDSSFAQKIIKQFLALTAKEVQIWAERFGVSTDQLIADIMTLSNAFEVAGNAFEDVAQQIRDNLSNLRETVYSDAGIGGGSQAKADSLLQHIYDLLSTSPMTEAILLEASEQLSEWYSAAKAAADEYARTHVMYYADEDSEGVLMEKEAAEALLEAAQQVEQIASRVESLIESIDGVIESIKYSQLNLSLPTQKAALAQEDYMTLRAKALGPDATIADVENFIGFAQTYLQQQQNAYKSSETYKSVYESVMADLETVKSTAQAGGYDAAILAELENIGARIESLEPDYSGLASTFDSVANTIEAMLNQLEAIQLILVIDWQNFNGTTQDIIEMLSTLVEAYGWENEVVLTWISDMAQWFPGDVESAIEVMQYIADNSGGWETDATLTFIAAWATECESIVDAKTLLDYIVGSTSWESPATLMFLASWAPNAESIADAISAINYLVGNTSWQSPATLTFIASWAASVPDLSTAEAMLNYLLAQNDDNWNSEPVLSFLANIDTSVLGGTGPESIATKLGALNFVANESGGWETDATLEFAANLAYDSSLVGSITWTDLEQMLTDLGATETVIKTFAAQYNQQLSTWASAEDFQAMLDGLDVPETVTATLEAKYQSGDLTLAEFQTILSAQGFTTDDILKITNELTGSVDVALTEQEVWVAQLGALTGILQNTSEISKALGGGYATTNSIVDAFYSTSIKALGSAWSVTPGTGQSTISGIGSAFPVGVGVIGDALRVYIAGSADDVHLCDTVTESVSNLLGTSSHSGSVYDWIGTSSGILDSKLNTINSRIVSYYNGDTAWYSQKRIYDRTNKAVSDIGTYYSGAAYSQENIYNKISDIDTSMDITGKLDALGNALQHADTWSFENVITNSNYGLQALKDSADTINSRIVSYYNGDTAWYSQKRIYDRVNNVVEDMNAYYANILNNSTYGLNALHGGQAGIYNEILNISANANNTNNMLNNSTYGLNALHGGQAGIYNEILNISDSISTLSTKARSWNLDNLRNTYYSYISLFTGEPAQDGTIRYNFNQYKKGGISWEPELALVGEVPEAHVPLENGSIPVRISGNGSSEEELELLREEVQLLRKIVDQGNQPLQIKGLGKYTRQSAEDVYAEKDKRGKANKNRRYVS